jgi:Protein of unknown function (DUF3047)
MRWAAILTALVVATPGLAGPVGFGSEQGWLSQTFPGYTPSRFHALGPATLQINSDKGNSLIWRPLPPDLASAGTAAWRWRVDQGVPPTDLGIRRAADRSIAVYFMFADDESALATPPTSLRAAMGKGRVLIYVWGGQEAAGSVVASPTLGERGKMLVQRPADSPTGTWQGETVDLRADFRRAYGRNPGPLLGIGVSSDSESTGTVTQAELADLVIR